MCADVDVNKTAGQERLEPGALGEQRRRSEHMQEVRSSLGAPAASFRHQRAFLGLGAFGAGGVG